MATRRARYGTVTSPTNAAINRDTAARTTDAHRCPASPDTVENSAAPNASPNPTSASKNLAHTSAVPDRSTDCRNDRSHAPAPPPAPTEFMVVDPTLRSLAPPEGTINEKWLAEKARVTCLESARSVYRFSSNAVPRNADPPSLVTPKRLPA